MEGHAVRETRGLLEAVDADGVDAVDGAQRSDPYCGVGLPVYKIKL
jgi:hypothetical protein